MCVLGQSVSLTRCVASLQIHMDLATYQEMGRFSKDLTPNLESAMYHLTKSGHCGNVDALYSLAHIYLQQSHDRVTQLSVEVRRETNWQCCVKKCGFLVCCEGFPRARVCGDGLSRASC